MKKRIYLLLSAVMILAFFAACGRNTTNNDGMDNGNGNSNVNQNQNDNNNNKETNTGRLNDVYQAVKSAYGENYLPNVDIDQDTLTKTYGINMDDVVEYKAETPMISANVDTFIGIEAKEGRADNVEAALKAYRDNLINNSVQYPANQYKVNASKVVRSGNYVFFVMLGANNDAIIQTADEAALKQFAEEQSQKAVDAINTTLGK